MKREISMDGWARHFMEIFFGDGEGYWNFHPFTKHVVGVGMTCSRHVVVQSSHFALFALRANVLENFIWFYGFSKRLRDAGGEGWCDGGREMMAMNGKCLFIEYGLMLNYERHKFCQFTKQNALKINEQ